MGFSDEKPRIRDIINPIILPASRRIPKEKSVDRKVYQRFSYGSSPSCPYGFQGRIFRCHLNSHGRDRDVCDGCGQ